MKTLRGFAFASEQQGGANMVDEQGNQMPAVIMISRIIFIEIGKSPQHALEIDSVFYGKNAVGFNVGEPIKELPDEVLNRLKKNGIKPDNVTWLPVYIDFGSNPYDQRSQFPMPVKILFTASGKHSHIIIQEEFWVKGSLLP